MCVGGGGEEGIEVRVCVCVSVWCVWCVWCVLSVCVWCVCACVCVWGSVLVW